MDVRAFDIFFVLRYNTFMINTVTILLIVMPLYCWLCGPLTQQLCYPASKIPI